MFAASSVSIGNDLSCCVNLDVEAGLQFFVANDDMRLIHADKQTFAVVSKRDEHSAFFIERATLADAHMWAHKQAKHAEENSGFPIPQLIDPTFRLDLDCIRHDVLPFLTDDPTLLIILQK